MSDPVKEKAASALWELAGDNPDQQRRVTKKIGLRQIKDMLNSKSEILQLVGTVQYISSIQKYRILIDSVILVIISQVVDQLALLPI